MKTGGTMNFLKRAGAILMLVAVFASSCNKYADDFKQLNTKLDALATSVAGVTQLSADLTSVKTQLTALQAAVAAQPNPTAALATLTTNLAAITTKVDAITTTLSAVATAGTATKAVVDGLKTDLAALALKVTDDNAALSTKIDALGTTDTAQTAQLNDLKDKNVALAASIADLQTSLNGLAQTGSDTDTATALTIKGLQLMLDAQKAQLDLIVANTTLTIASATISFPTAQVAQVGVVATVKPVNTVGSAVTAATYQWQVATTNGGTYSDISGAIASTYTIQAGDVDKFLKVKVTGTGSYQGSTTSATWATAVIAQQALAGVNPPVAVSTTNTSVQVNNELKVGTTTPANATMTYQWQSASTSTGSYSDIAGATSVKYTPKAVDAGMYLRVVTVGTFAFTGTVTTTSVGPVLSVATTSPLYSSVAGNNLLTVTLTGGTFKGTAAVPNTTDLAIGDFGFAGVDAAKFAAAGVVVTKTSATTATIQLPGASALSDGSVNTVSVQTSGMVTQASAVGVVASTVLAINTPTALTATTSVTAAHNGLTITLTGGTFKAAPIVAADFLYTPGANATAFAGAVFTRTSNTVVTVTGMGALAPNTTDVITVPIATQVTPAASVAVSGITTSILATPAIATAATDNAITVSLVAGSVFRTTTPLTASDFSFTVVNATAATAAADLALLQAGTVKYMRTSATTATITGFAALSGTSTVRVTVAAGAMSTVGISATIATSTIAAITDAAYTVTLPATGITFTLTGGGVFRAGTFSASDFSFTGPNASTLQTGTFTRVSDTQIAVTDVILVAGTTDAVLVKASALAATGTVTGASF